MNRGDRIRLTIERPAAGGRMIARHDGAIVFVAGAIPGEVVEAEIEKVQRGTGWAIARDILQPSPDRIDGVPDGACGGSVLAHVNYQRQCSLKSEIIVDTLRRLGRIALDQPIVVAGSPVDGYRMRARLHVRGGRIGFFREGTHSLCEPGPTRQLRSDAIEALSALERSLATLDRPTVSEIELSENVDATERALHLELVQDADPSRLATLSTVAGVTGVTCAPLDHPRTMDLWGSPLVTDRVGGATLTRHARSFFQGNRYLLTPLVEHVIGLIDDRPGVIDLYAGVGLFSVSAAVAGRGPVIAVEGDHFSADDLRRNAAGHDISVQGWSGREVPRTRVLRRLECDCRSAAHRPVEGRDRWRDSHQGGAAGLCVLRYRHAGPRCEAADRCRLSSGQRAGVRPVSEHRARRDGHRFRALDACTRPSNSSRNSPVRQKFSGCHCTATQKAASGFSMASMTPSGEVAVTSKPLATSLTDW